MSDHADRSDKLIFAMVQRGLQAVRRQPQLAPDGRCHFCDEDVAYGALFCDVDCRDDFEREQGALRRAGRT